MCFFKRLFRQAKVNQKLPLGWTETKIDNNYYIVNIPKEQSDKWTRERHKEDKVEKLINKNGFHIKQHGRAGTIYYVDQDQICELDFEISGVKQYDILIYFDSLSEWSLPKIHDMTENEKIEIKLKLQQWLAFKKIKASL